MRQIPKLGLFMLTALVAGNMIGSGVFLLPATLAKIGSISLLAWVVTAIGAVFLALIFAQLSRLMPKIGGPYAYCREAFGDFAGFLIAYNYWIAVWVGNAAIAIAFVGYLAVFFPILNANLLLRYITAVIAVWFTTVVNMISVHHAGVLQLITTVLKVIPIILIALIGIWYIHPENFAQFNLSGFSGWHAFSTAAALTLWSFIGLESATVPAENVNKPEKTISRATILGVTLTAILYILSSAAIMGIIPLSTLANSTAPYTDAAMKLFGPIGGSLVGIGAVIACFGALNGWVLLQGQIGLALARDNLFPAAFAKQNRNGSPYIGLLISSFFISVLLLMTLNANLVAQFKFIILLATLASLIPYFFSTMASLLI
ncbi:MAG: amino acid permease, partial [Pseudomonadota bacterium]